MSLRYLIVTGLVAAILSSAIGVINAKHQNRQSFGNLQSLQKQRDEMEIEWGRLQLEQGAWATHGRVEQLARKQLDMIIPPTKSIVVIQP